MPEFRTFTSQAEREDWLIHNADYFTVIYRRDLHNYRLEFPTLQHAQFAAYRIAERLMLNTLIYAVSGINDTFVEGYEYNIKGVRQKHARRDPLLPKQRGVH